MTMPLAGFLNREGPKAAKWGLTGAMRERTHGNGLEPARLQPNRSTFLWSRRCERMADYGGDPLGPSRINLGPSRINTVQPASQNRATAWLSARCRRVLEVLEWWGAPVERALSSVVAPEPWLLRRVAAIVRWLIPSGGAAGSTSQSDVEVRKSNISCAIGRAVVEPGQGLAVSADPIAHGRARTTSIKTTVDRLPAQALRWQHRRESGFEMSADSRWGKGASHGRASGCLPDIGLPVHGGRVGHRCRGSE
jgi:hypothetical protein